MEKEIICSDKAPGAIGPYSQAVRVKPFVFVSGQIPLDPETGKVVEGDVKNQTRQVLENIRNILTTAGSSLDNVVKTTIYLSNMSDYDSINEIYGNYFKDSRPARATVEVSRLPKDVSVEIEAVAIC